MVKIMIYHVKSHSELFIIKFRKKLRNVIGFDTGTSSACTCRMPKSNPTQNKYNPLNSFAPRSFTKETFGKIQKYDM